MLQPSPLPLGALPLPFLPLLPQKASCEVIPSVVVGLAVTGTELGAVLAGGGQGDSACCCGEAVASGADHSGEDQAASGVASQVVAQVVHSSSQESCVGYPQDHSRSFQSSSSNQSVSTPSIFANSE